MLTKLIIRNFKRFDECEIELGNPVVFIGPNNSGKTTALQAISLWEIGLKRWLEKRKGQKSPEKRPGVTINRRDLIAVPVPNANLLWRELHVRKGHLIDGKQKTENIRIDIVLHGMTKGKIWQCGLEFDYANEESFHCRPLRVADEKDSPRMDIPDSVETVQMAYLPPMSGLAANEFRLDPGAINVRIGEGRTAEVLRNLCFKIYESNSKKWEELTRSIKKLFGSVLEVPQYVSERGEILIQYIEHGIRLDLSCSGRGLQQTLLLLSYMYANPGAVLLIDEPDAHLEILRQRQIYELLSQVALENSNQLIIASHSEVLLNEAADRDVVVAFIGQPHVITDRGSQLAKSLRDIGWEHYYQAEQTGWILYLEGSTDLAILKAFAEKLEYKEAMEFLEMPFIHYVGNNLDEVRRHFFGLKEAVPNLKGIAILDRLEREAPREMDYMVRPWRKREIENYLCSPQVLEAYAAYIEPSESAGPLFDPSLGEQRVHAMQQSIEEVSSALKTLGKGDPWDGNSKVSEDFLSPLFKSYFSRLKLYNVMDKKNFHELARFIKKENIDPEVREKLDAIIATAKSAATNR